MSRPVAIRLLVALAVVLIGGTVWFAADAQRRAADHGFGQIAAAQKLHASMLQQSVGLNAYAATGLPQYLDRYELGRRRFELDLVTVRHGLEPGEARERRTFDAMVVSARRWQGIAERQMGVLRVGRPLPGDGADDLARVGALDRFDRAGESLIAQRDAERRAGQGRARTVALAAIAVLALLLAGIGYLVFDRRASADQRRRHLQERFAEVLQLARSEGEAYEVIKRHLERVVRGATATVLNRNHSDDRLEARTRVAEGSALEEALAEARPDSCVAIRAGRPHVGGEPDELLACAVCGKEAVATSCVPSLVGGAVVGSVLVQRPDPLDAREEAQLRATVAESAAVVANLRNLALAETRAATDALTGLANARALHETIKRMAAQASRAATPLAAILFDLDHFKQVNDTYGHDAGDSLLAAVADAAAASLRASDFLGRYGGEEFLVLLPDTDKDGALGVAEKLRESISALKVKGVQRRVTASFGVAVMPDDAGDSTELLRVADRALYTAKASGRDRVETARFTQAAPLAVVVE